MANRLVPVKIPLSAYQKAKKKQQEAIKRQGRVVPLHEILLKPKKNNDPFRRLGL